MKSHELLKEVLQQSNPKELASELGLSLSLIYKWAEPVGSESSGSLNPLDRVATLLRFTKEPRIAQWVCEQAGGFFVRNAASAESSGPLIPLMNGIVQEFAEMLSIIASAAGDNSVSPAEATHIRNRWEDLKSVTEGFVRGAENGNFQLPTEVDSLQGFTVRDAAGRTPVERPVVRK